MDRDNKKPNFNATPSLTVSGMMLPSIEKSALSQTIIDRFEEIVFANPDKLAIKDHKISLSFKQLHARISALTHQLRKNTDDDFPIGIAIENNSYFPIAMLATLAVGKPYVPLDLNNPIERNNLIIRHSLIKYVIVQKYIIDFPNDIIQIKIADKTEEDKNSIKIDQIGNGKSLAYIIYTSGSSGKPKGVYQNQENLIHDVLQYILSIELKKTDRLSLLYSPSVGGSIRDIFGALLTGASLHIYPVRKLGIVNIDKFLQEEKITIYHSIPNIFRTFLKRDFDKKALSTIRIVYLAGDRIFNSDIEMFKKYFPDDAVAYVGIGATEVATIYHQWFIKKNTPCPFDSIPVGFQIPDKKTEIIRDDGSLAEVGEVGEIKISSKFISLGYWNEPELTASRFSFDDESRSFYSGDLGRINKCGMLEFIGRKDSLVKVNGHRIELSEIEASTMKIQGIKACAAILYTANDIPFTSLFFVSDHKNSENKVKTGLNSMLPEYMIPRFIIQLDKIPMLPNFKNDNHSLKEILEKYLSKKSNISELSEEKYLLNEIRPIWSSFLGSNSFEKNLSWNDSGGDSISLVHMIVQLELNLGTKIDNKWINGKLNPQELVNKLATLKLPGNNNSLPSLYYFPPLNGMTENGRNMMQDLSNEFSIKIIKYPNWDSIEENKFTIEQISKILRDQIIDYDEPSVSYLGNCQGVSFMRAVFHYFPLEKYRIIGVIDGINNIVDLEEQPFIYRFVKNLNRSYLKPQKYIKLFNNLEFYIKTFYFNNDFFRKNKKYWGFFLSPLISRITKVEMIFFDFAETVFSDLQFIEFCSEDNIHFKNSKIHKADDKKNIYVKLRGTHKDLLSEENRLIIRNFIQSKI